MHQLLTINLRHKYYFKPHLTDEETNAESPAKLVSEITKPVRGRMVSGAQAPGIPCDL